MRLVPTIDVEALAQALEAELPGECGALRRLVETPDLEEALAELLELGESDLQSCLAEADEAAPLRRLLRRAAELEPALAAWATVAG
ncbi:MAG: hypothetical protein EVA89_06750 [Sandaracinaceae bacterium]|nr:MAG: hypothetical protein EVA89_06750 [Sandaracinaceae bacterium]